VTDANGTATLTYAGTKVGVDVFNALVRQIDRQDQSYKT